MNLKTKFNNKLTSKMYYTDNGIVKHYEDSNKLLAFKIKNVP